MLEIPVQTRTFFRLTTKHQEIHLKIKTVDYV